MIKALIFDIDDTLIKRGDGHITSSALEGIAAARAKGIKIIVATGRGYSFMQTAIKTDLKADYYITVNGTCISEGDGTPVKTVTIDKEELNKVMDICFERDYPFAIKCPTTFACYNKYDDFISQYCSKGVTPDMILDKTAELDYHLKPGNDPLDVFMYSPEKEAMKLQSQFSKLTFYPAYKNGCECSSNTANKGKAIKNLLEMLKIDLKDCIAFGDAENDIEMMKMCGVGVCMGNGTEVCKAAADYITDSIDEDGIYNALKHFEVI